ncbi:cholinesterase isoform X1 [Palaemon carinicauda]|uniref:cholinesterase isoform X1 n=1 Tax=Palaemon carinicauda TaxID=392227 RepID=UPI0035B61A80
MAGVKTRPTRTTFVKVFRLLCIIQCCLILPSAGQFRNDQDPEYYRYNNQQYPPLYSTPSPVRTLYSSGDTHFGTDRRYDTRYDDPTRPRGFDNRYKDPSYRYGDPASNDRLSNIGGGRYDSRGRERQGYESRRNWDGRNTYGEFGVLGGWRPDLQGEQRPSEIPGIQLPLADVFVTTDSGKVQGFYVYLYDKPGQRFDERPANKPIHQQRHILNVTTFLGIPYARPPIEEGRFKPPRRVQNWYSTWQALDYQSACPQNLKYTGLSNGIRNGIHEDCLYLNIFSPSVSVNVRDMYPVMFYIHGGDLDHGASNQFPGHMLSAWGEVVVVTINYRLGALGFLSTGDENSPGNYGLMDMAMALEWVYTNIRFFNGDRNKITAFGPGAGGAMAGLLAVLPRTKEMVSQVIGASGSPLADWAAIDDVYRVQNTSRVYGLEVGCTVESSYKLLQCLNRRSYEELASAPIKPDIGTFAWGPAVDKNFTVPGNDWYEDWLQQDWHILPDLPLKLYERNHHHPHLRYLTGVNRDGAAKMVYDDSRLLRNNYEVSETFFNERVKDWVKHYNYSLNPEGAFDAIKWMYTFKPDPHNTTHIREQYVNMLSDALYKSGVDHLVKVLVNSTLKSSVPTYYYLLNTTVEALKLPFWREIPNNIEYYFISGAPFMDPDFYPENFRVSRNQWGEGDRNMSHFMMKAFANFAKWGNPTQVQIPIMKVNWEQVLEGNLKYLSINTTFNTSMHFNYRQTYNSFWSVYMPQVVREWVPTVPPPINPWIQLSQPIVASFYGAMAFCVVLLVILFVCCGLWKSAKRQRNKALDDLQYYSTENLNPVPDDDYKVREYLNKLSNNNHEETAPSRSMTPTTLISTDQSTHHEMTAFKTQDQYMAKSVDQLNYPSRHGRPNGRMTKSTDNIIENYNVYPNSPTPTETSEKPPQRPITPISTLESEPNGRMFSSYIITKSSVQPPSNNTRAQPIPAVRTSRSTATISSNAGLLHTDL